MTTIPASRPLTDAVLAALRATHPRIGDAIAPEGAATPYAVLFPSGPGRLDGPLGDRHADADSLLQLTCIGITREQAEWLADLLRPVLLGPLTVPGRKVIDSWLETSQPVRRDLDTEPELFYAVDQVRIVTTPA